MFSSINLLTTCSSTINYLQHDYRKHVLDPIFPLKILAKSCNKRQISTYSIVFTSGVFPMSNVYSNLSQKDQESHRVLTLGGSDHQNNRLLFRLETFILATDVQPIIRSGLT